MLSDGKILIKHEKVPKRKLGPKHHKLHPKQQKTIRIDPTNADETNLGRMPEIKRRPDHLRTGIIVNKPYKTNQEVIGEQLEFIHNPMYTE